MAFVSAAAVRDRARVVRAERTGDIVTLQLVAVRTSAQVMCQAELRAVPSLRLPLVGRWCVQFGDHVESEDLLHFLVRDDLVLAGQLVRPADLVAHHIHPINVVVQQRQIEQLSVELDQRLAVRTVQIGVLDSVLVRLRIAPVQSAEFAIDHDAVRPGDVRGHDVLSGGEIEADSFDFRLILRPVGPVEEAILGVHRNRTRSADEIVDQRLLVLAAQIGHLDREVRRMRQTGRCFLQRLHQVDVAVDGVDFDAFVLLVAFGYHAFIAAVQQGALHLVAHRPVDPLLDRIEVDRSDIAVADLRRCRLKVFGVQRNVVDSVWEGDQDELVRKRFARSLVLL